MRTRIGQSIAALALAGWLAACGGTSGGPTDGGGTDGGRDGGDSQATYVKPEGYASVTFFVDDKANQTYSSGDIQWKGSFIYDDQTNIITYDGSWAGEQGPYPVLYDDGPISQGGHEMPGASAGDHVFSVEVYVKADASFDQEYQYGAINERGNWIWEGPNGEFVLPAGSTDRLDAQGYYIHAFGTYDIRVALDTAELHEMFLPFDPAINRIYLKGSMNSWAERQLLDNGEKGDQAAGDGVYTYWHSQNMGEHDGLLFAGQHVQFVFLIDDFEYKRVDALSEGVSAWTNCEGPDVWDSAPIIMENESRGRIKNTTVVVCEGAGGVTVSQVVPSTGPPEGGTQVSVYGAGFVDGASVRFGGELATEVEYVDAGQINCLTPAHDPGSVTVAVANPSGDRGELDSGFTYSAGGAPAILFIRPSVGPTSGGTAVTISGTGFSDGASITFGTSLATDVAVASQSEITCTTPAHAAGSVMVTVTNPGGLAASFPNGFEYSDSTGPVIQYVEPAVGPTSGGTAVVIHGGGFAAGANVDFDGQVASDIQVLDEGAIACTTPAHAEGPVDVRVVNPDLQQDVLASGFVYEKPAVDWAAIMGPMVLTLDIGQDSELVFAQAYESDVTPGDGCTGQITAELGYGPVGSIPAEDDPETPAWSWTPAECNLSCLACGNNDEYMASLHIDTSGQFHFAYRFSLDDGETWIYADGESGTLDGYQPENAGQVTVRSGGDELQIWEVDPPAGTILGGTLVTVSGNAFEDGATVWFDSQELATTFVDTHQLQVTTPVHEPGAVQVRVVNPGPTHPETSLVGGYTYVLRHTPTIDGIVGADWPAEHQVAECAAASDWGSNVLQALWVAFDDTNLYLGIRGFAEGTAGNTIVVYLDVDHGTPNGIANMNDLTDNHGTDTETGIDDAISSRCVATAPGFAADFAVATKGMAGVDAGLDVDAGLRGLLPVDDFPWLVSTVQTSTGEQSFAEAAVPWTSLFAGGLPAEGTRMAVFARLLNFDGQYLSNQTLPADNPSSPEQIGAVFVFDVK
ncbi:MAG: IPT/TIG domain-containing protein [Deltaproteobacteria bacterium]|nr:IPT/TIG domain-containing protein [Deltaproteobacteria bacterium]